METLSIADLKERAAGEPGEYRVHGQVAAVARRETKAGKPFYEVELADGAGSIKLKAWADSPAFPQAEVLRGGEFACASGHWSQSEYGLDARDWTLRPLTDEETDALLAGSGSLRAKQDADYAHIATTCDGLGEPRLRALCERFLDRFGARFRRAAAARSNHHARRGGLVEHTAQMMRCADAIAGAYPHLNRDLLLAGVLFHDCGKLWENCYPERGFTMPHDFRAELLGHIPIGAELVNALWRELEAEEQNGAWRELDPPSDHVRVHLLHLILSHHGQLEYGSPVLPKTPEAMALHFVDNIDAKLEMFADGYAGGARRNAEVYDRVWALGANLVRPLAHFEGDRAAPPGGAERGSGPLAD